MPGARSESQCGFREGRGTLDGLFVFLHLVQRATAKRRPLYVVLVDFRMAFDVVDRALLQEHWRSMGISGVFLGALSRLYQHIRMQVHVNGEMGPSFPTTRGTKQGSILSPQLFGFFIETICPLLEARCPGAGPLIGLSTVPNLLYADDLTLFAESEKDMNALLGALDLFCHLMRMVVNLDKTVALVFACRPHAPAPVFSYRGTHIQIVPKAKYLGLKFDSTKGIAEPPPLETAEARMHTLLHRCWQLHMDTPDLACRLFDALIWPMLLVHHSTQVWGPALAHHQVHSLDPKGNPYDALHMKFLRAVGGLPQSSHKLSVLAEFGRIPLMHRVVRDAAAFWEITRRLPPGRLRRAAMEDSIQLWLHNRRTSCWAGHLLACMQTAGVVTAAQLNACTTVHEVWALGITRRSVVTTLAAASAQVWAGMPADPRAIPATDPTPAPHHGPRSRADTGRVACTYASWVRAGAARAPHLGVPLPTQVHKILIKLRVTGAPLRVVTGTFEGAGHRGIPYAQRVCLMCACSCHHCTARSSPVEDLKHLLLECPAYACVRAKWPQILPQVPQPPPPVESLVLRRGSSRCPRGFDVSPRYVAPPSDCPASVLNQQDQVALAYAISDVLAHRNRALNMCQPCMHGRGSIVSSTLRLLHGPSRVRVTITITINE